MPSMVYMGQKLNKPVNKGTTPIHAHVDPELNSTHNNNARPPRILNNRSKPPTFFSIGLPLVKK
jgi:hypothetical protein